MQETNRMCDQLINEFTENYMEKLFYFCLKRQETMLKLKI